MSHKRNNRRDPRKKARQESAKIRAAAYAAMSTPERAGQTAANIIRYQRDTK